MPGFVQLLQEGADLAALTALLYQGTITALTLTAMLAPTRERRRAARDILRILLRHTGDR